MPPMRGYCGSAMQEFQTFNRRSKVMTALGNNVHIFARPYRRQELTWSLETVLGCGPVAPVEHPGDGRAHAAGALSWRGHLSIEFIEEAPDHATPRLGEGWLELRAENPEGSDADRTGRRSDPGQASRPSPPLHGTGGPGVHHRAADLSLTPGSLGGLSSTASLGSTVRPPSDRRDAGQRSWQLTVTDRW